MGKQSLMRHEASKAKMYQNCVLRWIAATFTASVILFLIGSLSPTCIEAWAQAADAPRLQGTITWSYTYECEKPADSCGNHETSSQTMSGHAEISLVRTTVPNAVFDPSSNMYFDAVTWVDDGTSTITASLSAQDSIQEHFCGDPAGWLICDSNTVASLNNVVWAQYRDELIAQHLTPSPGLFELLPYPGFYPLDSFATKAELKIYPNFVGVGSPNLSMTVIGYGPRPGDCEIGSSVIGATVLPPAGADPANGNGSFPGTVIDPFEPVPTIDFRTLPQYQDYSGQSFDGCPARAHLEVTGSIGPCGLEPEVVVTVDGYDNWVPEAKYAELEEGNSLVLKATMCPISLRARRFTFELLSVSSEPGVCMNYPFLRGPPSGLPDLGFLTERNPAPWLSSGDPSFVLETEDGVFTESPPAVLSSFDWGGSATVKVTAELLDGRKVVGHINGDKATKLIPVPKRKDGSRIADAWKVAAGVTDLADSDDGEVMPVGDGHSGDGLTLYEEYRGFCEGAGRDHVHGNPKKKDLFIVDEAGAQLGIALVASSTNLNVHSLRFGQLSADRLVNANRSSQVDGALDQHGLLVLQTALGESILGKAEGGPGLPRSVFRVSLRPTFGPKFVLAIIPGGNSVLVNEKTSVTAHEILHGCNVYHHGSTDRNPVTWLAVQRPGGLAYTEDGAEVFLAEEGPCGARQWIQPKDANDHLRDIGVATQGGQHSGHQDCVMRYYTAGYYEDDNIDDFYWHHPPDETPGFTVCASALGTGVNAKPPEPPGHCPQSRYGNAKAGCCLYQICVNDRRDHEADAGATACPAGGGTGEVSEPESGAGGAEEPARPILSLTVDEGMTVTIRRGRPALLVLEVASSRLGLQVAGAPLVVAAADGWTKALTFRLARDGASLPSWPTVPLSPAPVLIELGERGTALAAWWISPGTTAAMEPGTYSLESILDTTGARFGWSGKVRSEPVLIEVADEPTAPSAPIAAEKALMVARYRVWQGEFADALTLVDELISKDPLNVTGHWFRAEILEAKGDVAAALEAYKDALRADRFVEPDADEVPGSLLRGYEQLLASSEAGPPADSFRRGDANADGDVDVSDAVTTLLFLFSGSIKNLACDKTADVNDDGNIQLSDPVALLHHLFLAAPAPLPPFPGCGTDPTEDNLSCGSSDSCN